MSLRTLRAYEPRVPMGADDVSVALSDAEACASDATAALKRALERLHSLEMTDAASELATAIERLREALAAIEPTVDTALRWADAENDF